MQIYVVVQQRGWSRRTRDLSHVHMSWRISFSLYSSARPQPALVD